MHNGQNWLRNQGQRRQSMVRVIRPEYNRQKHGDIQLHDYIEVPRLSTFGTYTLMDMLSNDSIRNTIGIYNELKTRDEKRLAPLKRPARAVQKTA